MTDAGAEQTGTLEQALAQAARLLTEGQPRLAEVQAREILKSAPGHPVAELYLAAALRQQGQAAAALALLEPLAAAQPNASVMHLELGLALAAVDRGSEALEAMRRAVAIKFDLA